MSWTDERVELLRKLWLDGLSASQIAAELAHGITRNAVIGKVHRLGLSGRVAVAGTDSRGQDAEHATATDVGRCLAGHRPVLSTRGDHHAAGRRIRRGPRPPAAHRSGRGHRPS